MVDSAGNAPLPSPFNKLNQMQTDFARLYVLTRGDGVRSARVAGYKHPSVKSTHLSLHPIVSELIKTLALANATACLPVAIGALLDIAQDPACDVRTRRNAALDLAKIAGAMPKAGPTTAIQVNAAAGDGSAGNAQPVNVVLQNVWKARDAREVSEIVAPMHDTAALIDATPRDEGEGG